MQPLLITNTLVDSNNGVISIELRNDGLGTSKDILIELWSSKMQASINPIGLIMKHDISELSNGRAVISQIILPTLRAGDKMTVFSISIPPSGEDFINLDARQSYMQDLSKYLDSVFITYRYKSMLEIAFEEPFHSLVTKKPLK